MISIDSPCSISGFVMIYRYTRQIESLDAAERLIEYFIRRVPDDFVPLWDFDAPSSQPYKYIIWKILPRTTSCLFISFIRFSIYK